MNDRGTTSFDEINSINPTDTDRLSDYINKNLDKIDTNGNNLLLYAVLNNKIKVANDFIDIVKNNINSYDFINAQNKDGDTSLLIAVKKLANPDNKTQLKQFEYPKLIQKLIANGADEDKKNKKDEYPAMYNIDELINKKQTNQTNIYTETNDTKSEASTAENRSLAQGSLNSGTDIEFANSPKTGVSSNAETDVQQLSNLKKGSVQTPSNISLQSIANSDKSSIIAPDLTEPNEYVINKINNALHKSNTDAISSVKNIISPSTPTTKQNNINKITEIFQKNNDAVISSVKNIVSPSTPTIKQPEINKITEVFQKNNADFINSIKHIVSPTTSGINRPADVNRITDAFQKNNTDFINSIKRIVSPTTPGINNPAVISKITEAFQKNNTDFVNSINHIISPTTPDIINSPETVNKITKILQKNNADFVKSIQGLLKYPDGNISQKDRYGIINNSLQNSNNDAKISIMSRSNKNKLQTNYDNAINQANDFIQNSINYFNDKVARPKNYTVKINRLEYPYVQNIKNKPGNVHYSTKFSTKNPVGHSIQQANNMLGRLALHANGKEISENFKKIHNYTRKNNNSDEPFIKGITYFDVNKPMVNDLPNVEFKIQDKLGNPIKNADDMLARVKNNADNNKLEKDKTIGENIIDYEYRQKTDNTSYSNNNKRQIYA